MTPWFVYVMSNRTHRLYVGATNDLPNRVTEHRERRYENAFTAGYTFNRLVYFEYVGAKDAALQREREIKAWRREKKVALTQAKNPDWRDLTPSLTDLLCLK